MELMRLALLLCLAGQAVSRPINELVTSPQDNDGSGLGPTVFEIIEAANKDIPVLLKEGDIAVPISRDARNCKRCMWNKDQNGTVPVPYVIDPVYSASEVSLINAALKEFEVMTCVQFVNRTSESDYLYIESDAGCYSYIGRIFGKQTVSLAKNGCMVYGVIQHEAMHNIGFFHEHTRVDRDNYIDVLWQNIQPGYSSNFNINDGNTLNLPYDYTSVMHYYMYGYSITASLPTIVPKSDPTVPIGQRSGISNLDVMKINAYYSCNLCREKLVMSSGSLSGNSSYANQWGGNCLWLIQVPSKMVSLQIKYLNISSTDYIKVYDGVTKSSPVLLENTYEYGPISPLVSSGQNMLVEFASTKSSHFSEFDAIYKTVSSA